MKATRILAENVSELLRRKPASQHDLAYWCRRSDAWLTNVLNGKRGIQVEDLDRIADFFGYAGSVYKLFLPGTAASFERRKVNRRSGVERRIGHQRQMLDELRPEIDRARRPVPSYGRDDLSPEGREAIARATAAFDERVARILHDEARKQAAQARATLAETRRRRGGPGRSDAETA